MTTHLPHGSCFGPADRRFFDSCALQGLARGGVLDHCAAKRIFAMQRKRAIAIAAQQRQAFEARLLLAAGLLLLPALLLLLISP